MCLAGILRYEQDYVLDMIFPKNWFHLIFFFVSLLQSRFKWMHEQVIQTCGCFAVLLHSSSISAAPLHL